MPAEPLQDTPLPTANRPGTAYSRLALEAMYERLRTGDAADEMSEEQVDHLLSRATPEISPLPHPGDELGAARGIVWGLALSVPLWAALATLVLATS